MVHDLGAEYIYINASSENSIDVIRNQIAEFAQTMSFSGGQKVVILDEADGLTPQFQKALRAFIEEYQANCRFILTCNYLGKIIPALRQGRTQVFDFNMAKFKDELLPTIIKRITGILKFEKIEFDKPKVTFANSVVASQSSILIRELAKLLKQNHIDIGQNRLYEYLRENGYIIKTSTEPTQRAMNLGLFEVEESTYYVRNLPKIAFTTRVTPKGQIYFINKLTKERDYARG